MHGYYYVAVPDAAILHDTSAVEQAHVGSPGQTPQCVLLMLDVFAFHRRVPNKDKSNVLKYCTQLDSASAQRRRLHVHPTSVTPCDHG